MPRKTSRINNNIIVDKLPIETEVREDHWVKCRESMIHFVLPSGVTRENMSSEMSLAHDAIEKSKAQVDRNLIDFCEEDKLLKRVNEKPESVVGVFVLDSFEGELFSRLQTRSREEPKCRIFGPVAVAQIFGNNKNHPVLPVTRVPIINAALHGVIVGVAKSFGRQKFKELCQKLRPLGATVVDHAVKGLRIVVAEDQVCKMSLAARSLDIPVVRQEWVDSCWRKRGQLFYFSQEMNVKVLRVKPFQGMVFTPSQLEPVMKEKLKAMADKYGFKYSPDLRVGETTHLICQRPEGEKYRHARDWGLHTVNMTWVRQSIAKHCALPETGNFVVGGEADNSFDFHPVDQSISEIQATASVAAPSTSTQVFERRDEERSGNHSFLHNRIPDFVPEEDLLNEPSNVHFWSYNQSNGRTGCSQWTQNLSIQDEQEEEMPEVDQRGRQEGSFLSNVSVSGTGNRSPSKNIASQVKKYWGMKSNVLDGVKIHVEEEGLTTLLVRDIRKIIWDNEGSTSTIDDTVNFCLVSQREVTPKIREILKDIKLRGYDCKVVHIDFLFAKILTQDQDLDYTPFEITVSSSRPSSFDPNQSSNEIPNLLGFRVTKTPKTNLDKENRKRPSQETEKDILTEENDEELRAQYGLQSTQTLPRSNIIEEEKNGSQEETNIPEKMHVNPLGQVNLLMLAKSFTPTKKKARESHSDININFTQSASPESPVSSSQGVDVPEVAYGTQSEAKPIKPIKAKYIRKVLDTILDCQEETSGVNIGSENETKRGQTNDADSRRRSQRVVIGGNKRVQ